MERFLKTLFAAIRYCTFWISHGELMLHAVHHKLRNCQPIRLRLPFLCFHQTVSGWWPVHLGLKLGPDWSKNGDVTFYKRGSLHDYIMMKKISGWNCTDRRPWLDSMWMLMIDRMARASPALRNYKDIHFNLLFHRRRYMAVTGFWLMVF